MRSSRDFGLVAKAVRELFARLLVGKGHYRVEGHRDAGTRARPVAGSRVQIYFVSMPSDLYSDPNWS